MLIIVVEFSKIFHCLSFVCLLLCLFVVHKYECSHDDYLVCKITVQTN